MPSADPTAAERSDETILTADCPACPACGAAGEVALDAVQDHFFGAPGQWRLRRCDHCASLWLDPAPLASELGKAYRAYHTHLGSAGAKKPGLGVRWQGKWLDWQLGRREDYRALMAEQPLRRLMYLHDQPPGRLLDVGCGGGRYLRRMKARGWQVEGIDFDPQAAARVQRKYGITIHVGDLREVSLQPASLDAIVMSHAIEHVIDPVSLLQRCRQLLKPGGLLSIVTPNARGAACRHYGRYWRGLEVPRHVQVFSLQGLRACLMRAGFEVSASRSFSSDAEGVHLASARLQARLSQGQVLDADLHEQQARQAQQVRKAKLAMLAEFRLSRRHPDLGEDLMALARASASPLNPP